MLANDEDASIKAKEERAYGQWIADHVPWIYLGPRTVTQPGHDGRKYYVLFELFFLYKIL